MKATHWYVITDPEGWDDDPKGSACEAADHFFEWADDEAWDNHEQLRRDGSTEIIVSGYVLISEPLDPETAFDGYEPGDSYWTPTGEKVTVIIERNSRLKE